MISWNAPARPWRASATSSGSDSSVASARGLAAAAWPLPSRIARLLRRSHVGCCTTGNVPGNVSGAGASNGGACPRCRMEQVMKLRHLFMATAIASAAAGAAWSQTAPKPNDAQIAHIAYTADNIDIKAGQLALQKSQNPQVKAFAQDMVRDHTAVNEKALALAKKLGVQPQDNDTSRSLTRQAEAETKRLEALNGAAFDKAYADHELTYHRQVNEAVRGTLIPSASNAELKGLLQTGLKIFEGHQQHAEGLVQALR